METFDWRSFLAQWSREVLERDALVADLAPEVRDSGWLGYPGATEGQIAQAESRLSTRLPPSYRAFLGVTNGWRQAGFFIYRLYPVEEVEWHRTRHPDWIAAWMAGRHYYGALPPIPDADYFVYGDDQDPTLMRDEYLPTTLELSEDYAGNGMCLLNPQVVTPDGEWEAWFFASWLPGARRYRSFWELMQAEREAFLAIEA